MTTSKLVEGIDHIAIAVTDIAEAARFYSDVLGVTVSAIEEVPTQKTRVAFVELGPTRIELIEPMSEDSPVARFLTKRGSGLHHICLRTGDIDGALAELQSAGVPLIDKAARPGAHGCRVAFIHPKGVCGVLTELSESSPES